MEPSLSPFQQLRARGLLVQSLAAAFALLLGTRLAMGLNAEVPANDPASFALFYLAIGIVLVARMHAAKLDVARLFGPTPSRETLRLTVVAVPLALLSIAGFWILFLPLSYAAPDFVRRWAFEGSQALQSTSVPIWAGHFCIAVIIAPVIEETLFRGLLLQRWALRWGTTTGVVLSSLLFALGHVELVGHFLFGVAMAALYLRTRSLWVPIAAHSLNNFLASAFSLPDAISPKAAKTMTLASFRSEWWIGLILLVAGLGLLDVYRRRFWSDVDFRALIRGPVPYLAAVGETLDVPVAT